MTPQHQCCSSAVVLQHWKQHYTCLKFWQNMMIFIKILENIANFSDFDKEWCFFQNIGKNWCFFKEFTKIWKIINFCHYEIFLFCCQNLNNQQFFPMFFKFHSFFYQNLKYATNKFSAVFSATTLLQHLTTLVLCSMLLWVLQHWTLYLKQSRTILV